MGIGEAVAALREGKRLTRRGWHGANLYIYLDQYNGTEPFVVIDKEGWERVQPGWLCSQADLLADDWFIYKERV